VADLKALNLWDFEMIGLLKYNDGSVKDIPSIPANLKDKYKEVFQIDPSWLIKSAAHRGKWVDQSQSLNIYFAGTSGRELANVYEYAWSLGLKTTYYLRSLGASQVEKSTVNAAEFGSTHKRSAGGTSTDAVSSSDAIVSSMSPQMVSATVAPTAVTTKVEVVVPSVTKSAPIPSPITATVPKNDPVPVMAQQPTSKYKITVMPEATCDGCQ
jgi:ribonucleoside-diphosphate reductase alpha chain